MKKYRVFIDGQSGTTGLQIVDRLKHHEHIELLEIAAEDRKSNAAKRQLMKEADITFLCLPDKAAIESAQVALETNSRVIDASSTHRCHRHWVYGLAELERGQRDKIAAAQMVANPGCYATGALLLLKPLIAGKAITPDTAVHINGFSGYSGGGKSMIEQYKENQNSSDFSLYGLGFNHKHIAEIQKWSGLERRPTFFPSVVNCLQGMLVTIAFDQSELKVPAGTITELVRQYYQAENFVRFKQPDSLLTPSKFVHIEGLANTNFCDLSVVTSSEDDQLLLIAKLDNLGKGASGAAVQNMNIMLGLPEALGVAIDNADRT